MAERRENSVLFSLNELRNIESDRVRGEEEAERARIEAERRAREDEIRRAKEAEEAKRRAEEDRVRRDIEEKERIVRENELRLKESERRAQIEAAAKLEQARIEAEARARIEGKKFPTTQVVAGVDRPGRSSPARPWATSSTTTTQELARKQAEEAQKADGAQKQAAAPSVAPRSQAAEAARRAAGAARQGVERRRARADSRQDGGDGGGQGRARSRRAPSRAGASRRQVVEAGHQGHQRSARRPRPLAAPSPLLPRFSRFALFPRFAFSRASLVSRPDGTLVPRMSRVRHTSSLSAEMKKARFLGPGVASRCRPDLNRGMTDLQSVALPAWRRHRYCPIVDNPSRAKVNRVRGNLAR